MTDIDTRNVVIKKTEELSEQNLLSAFDVNLPMFLHPYESAMKLMCAKLEFLDNEFSITNNHNPIHVTQCRLKTPMSIYEKTKRKGLSFNSYEVAENILDIAGVRVVCNYIDDVYLIAEKILQQSDISVVRTRDYIKNPKPNGYRSLHLVLSVPVQCFGEQKRIAVEVQLRTIAMDMWASLEHELQYKATRRKTELDRFTLRYCADELIKVDKLMQSVYTRPEKNLDVV